MITRRGAFTIFSASKASEELFPLCPVTDCNQYLDSLLGSGSDPTSINSIKNKTLAGLQRTLQGDYSVNREAGYKSLGDYISSFLGNTPAATRNTGEEVANIGRFYSGEAGNELAGIRNQTYRDALAANDLASRFYLRNAANQSVTGTGSGSSSYFTRQALANLAPIQANAALTRDAQARSDWQAIEDAKRTYTGQRTALEDALAGRSLVPAQASNALLSQNIGQLGALGQIDQANTFYGLKAHPGIGQGFLSDYGSVMDAY